MDIVYENYDACFVDRSFSLSSSLLSLLNKLLRSRVMSIFLHLFRKSMLENLLAMTYSSVS